MTYYFGFAPTATLSTLIDDANRLVATKSSDPYYPLRNQIAQQISHEMLDNLIIQLISVIPDAERKAKMTKIVANLEGANKTMLSILLGKDSNSDVLPNLDYLNQETIFVDNEGKRRIGFVLDPAKAKIILDGFNAVTPDSSDREKLQAALVAMNHAVMHHFITRFAETLPLGLIKRNSVPVAKAAINKAVDVAIHKLLPQLPLASQNRLVDFYRPYIVVKGPSDKDLADKPPFTKQP